MVRKASLPKRLKPGHEEIHYPRRDLDLIPHIVGSGAFPRQATDAALELGDEHVGRLEAGLGPFG